MDGENRSLMSPFFAWRGMRASMSRFQVPPPATHPHPGLARPLPPPAAHTVRARIGHRSPPRAAGATLPCATTVLVPQLRPEPAHWDRCYGDHFLRDVRDAPPPAPTCRRA